MRLLLRIGSRSVPPLSDSIATTPHCRTAEVPQGDGSPLSTLTAQVAALRAKIRSGSGFRAWKPDIFYFLFALVAGILFALSVRDSGVHNWAILLSGFALGLLCAIPPRLKNRFRFWVQIDRPNRRLQRRLAPLVAEIDRLRSGIVQDLERLLEPGTEEVQEAPLRWTCRSMQDLTGELNRHGHTLDRLAVAQLLEELGYTPSAQVGLGDSSIGAVWNARFALVNCDVKRFLADRQPVISIDTRQSLGRSAPFGERDPEQDSQSIDRETAALALDRILLWWRSVGQRVYPQAQRLLITVGFGGNNTPHVRLSKPQLQEVADATGLRIAVCHFPPGVSKWNGIEHRLFSVRGENGGSTRLLRYKVVVHLIAPPSAAEELKVHARDNEDPSPEPPGDWKYQISPRLGAAQEA